MREALISQLAYLCDEVRMLKPMAEALPAGLFEARRMENSPSLKEIYARLLVSTAVDAKQSLTTGELVEESDPDSVVSEAREEISTILDRLAKERSLLVTHLEQLPANAWERGGIVWRVATHLAEQDFTLQQTAAEILSEWSPNRPG